MQIDTVAAGLLLRRVSKEKSPEENHSLVFELVEWQELSACSSGS